MRAKTFQDWQRKFEATFGLCSSIHSVAVFENGNTQVILHVLTPSNSHPAARSRSVIGRVNLSLKEDGVYFSGTSSFFPDDWMTLTNLTFFNV